ncbi:MaoC family dehydratase N-terminal domain-containing protein [Rhodococcus sp. JVH1]|uniref:MaoC family dehydratase n=1 Tax=Rhodococcus sp. JVH1 TaxID=745408 RepID=UPI0012F6CF4A|nr:MaoC family dehydratase N-terminal domain-containing protein [Rhodococcus sp. JVH1]
MTCKSWDEVSVDDALPELRYPITLKTLLLQSVGNRDFFPYHHNRDFTQKLGIRDAFVNTTFFQALFGRYVTDWSGPESVLVSMTLRMRDQLCPGDTAIVAGRVTDRSADTTRALVTVDLDLHNEHGPVASCTVVLVMPSADLGPVVVQMPPAAPEPQRLDGTPEQAIAELGRRIERDGPYPVSEAQIMYWCEMVRDGHPGYVDGDFATSHGGVVAPAQSLIMWAQPRATQMGLDWDHPDVDLPDQRPWPEPAGGRPFEFRVTGTTDIIVQDVHCEFGEPLRPGDRVTASCELISCSGLKRTRLGDGYFVTSLEVYRNQHGTVVGHTVMTMLQYGPPPSDRQ